MPEDLPNLEGVNWERVERNRKAVLLAMKKPREEALKEITEIFRQARLEYEAEQSKKPSPGSS